MASPKRIQKALPMRQPKSYAAYVLNEGTPTEKRELLGMLKNKLVIKNRVVLLKCAE